MSVNPENLDDDFAPPRVYLRTKQMKKLVRYLT